MKLFEERSASYLPEKKDVITLIREGKNFLLLLVVLSLSLSLIMLAILDKRYTSVATVLPSESTRPGFNLGEDKFSRIAFSLGISGKRNNLPLYPVILRSRRVSRDILDRDYMFYLNGRKVCKTLREHLGADNEDAAFFKLISKVASFRIDRETSTLVIKVITSSPELSAGVVNAYIERLEQFNMNDHRSNSERVYRFIEKKVRENKLALNRAEENLRAFREKNRNFNISTTPQLQMKHRRLLRKVEVEEALFIEFGKQLNEAAVDMRRGSPILNVLDQGVAPPQPSWPRPVLFVITFVLAALFGGSVFLMARESFRRWRGGSDAQVVEQLIDELKGDLKSVPLVGSRL
jgi:uncharacterized protein involved in exopolysaccharide biosynthesis